MVDGASASKLSEWTVVSHNPDRLSVSSPGDFVVEAGRAVDVSRMREADVSPYCFDVANRNLLCVSTPDLSDEVFFYQAQRQYARSVIRVPLELLPAGPASPALIFSIGRCGSTLLVKALQAAGLRAVSEPDFFRQAAYYQSSGISLQGVLAGATGLLPYSVLKLHLECNNAPLLITGAFRAPRVMFILRDPIDWAASLRRISRNSIDPRWAASLLRTGLLALDQLTRHHHVRICYYEDFRELDEDYVASVLAWAGASGTVSREVLAAVAAKDAQDGTFVSRSSLRDVPDDAPFCEAFRREWSRWRPVEVIDRLRLKLV
jgi:hypothetical protein